MADRSVRVRLEAITSNFNRRISESAVLTRRFSRELESADGRMANMVQSTLALAPALVPIGAAGIPAIAGLTAQLGFATLGVGALVLGLNGVSDTLDALNNYQLDPTEAHFKKLREEIGKLGPAGGEFVLFLDHLEPRFRRIQALAEQGLLPGVEAGITHVLQLMPQLREIVFTVSSTLGDLIRDAGDNLDDPRWQEFFGFIENRARPTLVEAGQAVGNFALSFANLVEAFGPLEDDFSKGLLDMSRRLRDWSANLEDTQGFQELVDYIRENGPKALDTLAALGGALVEIVEAAAPVGSLALPILTDLLKVVGAIADTPLIGSGLVALAAAIGIYGRSLDVLKAVGLRGDQGVLASTFKGAKTSIREAAAALTEVTSAQDRARLSATQLAAAEERRAAAIRGGFGTIAKGAALAAGFTVANTGLADSLGLSNTASLALMGTFLSPGWGTAIGGSIGLVTDLANANDDLESAMSRANTAAVASVIDFGAQRRALEDLIAKNEEYHDSLAGFDFGGGFDSPKSLLKSIADQFTHSGEEGTAAVEKQSKALQGLRDNTIAFYAALHNGDSSMLKATDDELTRFVDHVAPALQSAGIDVRDLLTDRTGWLEAQFAVRDWVNEMDSARGKSKAVGDALAELESEITPTVDAAKQLSDALDTLFGTKLSQAEALDRWIQGLHDLRETLKGTSNALEGNSEDALKNRAAIRDSVQDLLNRVEADAAAGKSAKAVAKELRDGRQAILDQATAAGLSEPEVKAYLRHIGLSAKNLNTIFDETRTKLHKIGDGLRGLKDKTVTIRLREIYDRPGAPAPPTSARGNIFYYANGEVANRHMPELAGPGPTRVWREPETGGEAYIPLANDFRRPRAIDIWERTGMALGVQFRRYAFGGMSLAAAGGGGTVRLAREDIMAIADVVIAARPVYGDAHFYGDAGSTFRQMHQDRKQSSLDGVPRAGSSR